MRVELIAKQFEARLLLGELRRDFFVELEAMQARELAVLRGELGVALRELARAVRHDFFELLRAAVQRMRAQTHDARHAEQPECAVAGPRPTCRPPRGCNRKGKHGLRADAA